MVKYCENLTWIHLMLANVTHIVYSMFLLESCFCNFNFQDFAVKSLQNLQSRIVSYGSYKQFLKENLLHNLSTVNLESNVDGFQTFGDIAFETLIKHVPYKKKLARSNK